jgi:hypothetical protein
VNFAEANIAPIKRVPLSISRQHDVAVHKRQAADARAHKDLGNLRSHRTGTDHGRATSGHFGRAT